ncbi:hypothetical protein [Parvicella tangerina]|uniref:Uncharacterized protein n=1 Tax=Parvicella tangerina TaxID=2829795 RepID=A0A916JQN8_9FLAO|nr:hypothetical protein [Parvicella tangerina]CAG5087610.1 hypothetical protein CRYO30217_03526 [Parvicella tangerina]
MRPFNPPKQYIFTIIFGLLVIVATAGKPKTSYFTGKWDGNMVQINNPKRANKNKFCIKKIYVNGKKIKANYKSQGIEFDPSAYGFEEGQELLIEIISKDDCEPTFHSEGFIPQRD